MAQELELTFYGGTEGPTGSNFLLKIPGNRVVNILIDCGLFQGSKMFQRENTASFQYNASEIDYLFITHAHIDHIGRIPKLIREGFKGKIISTPPTKDISELMLKDYIHVMKRETDKEKKEIFYTKKDVESALNLWDGILYHEKIKIGDAVIELFDSGHILGSSIVQVSIKDNKIAFTGDLGNHPAPLLHKPEILNDISYLVIESVYGDREHEGMDVRRHMLEDIIEEAVKKVGTLMIPAFSLERTQAILFEINRLKEEGRIPDIDIYIDSPLAIEVTKTFKKYSRYFNKEVQEIIKKGEDIFNFRGVKFTYSREDSMAIEKEANPKIIIAGSGMSNGGRIVFHEKKYLGDPKNTLLIVGYQIPGSLGRELQDGATKVNINGTEIKVRATIKTIHGYSAHMDSQDLLNFIAQSADSLKEIFVVGGESKSALFLVQRIRDYLGIKARAPKMCEKVKLNLK